MNDLRNLQDICALLHRVRQGWQGPIPNNIDELIRTAEDVYHGRKENG